MTKRQRRLKAYLQSLEEDGLQEGEFMDALQEDVDALCKWEDRHGMEAVIRTRQFNQGERNEN